MLMSCFTVGYLVFQVKLADFQHLPSFYGRFPNLQAVQLEGGNIALGPRLAALAEALPRLERLKLAGHVADADMRFLAPLAPTLTALDLAVCDIVGNDGIAAIAEALPSLRNVTLTLAEAKLGDMARLTQLTSLAMCNCTLDDRSLQGLAPLRHTLRRLDACACHVIESLQHLTVFSALTELGVRSCTGLGEGTLKCIAALPQLSSLEAANLSAVTNAEVGHLATATRLTRLDLGHANELTSDGLAHLLPLAGCLRSLNLEYW